MVVEQNDYISVDGSIDEACGLNVYIDRHDSAIDDELNNVEYDRIDVPTSIIIDGEEADLGLGKHKIVCEFKFTNTTSVCRSDAYISDSVIYFDFQFVRISKNPPKN